MYIYMYIYKHTHLAKVHQGGALSADNVRPFRCHAVRIQSPHAQAVDASKPFWN